MLRAIAHSKDRTIKLADFKPAGSKEIYLNFRELYQDIEDFFTAAIFSRLCYLEGKIWQEIFNIEFGELKSREFWVRWDYEGSYIEPDVFIRFEKCDVIIEAKRYDGAGQYEQQLYGEIEAYQQNYPNNKNFYLFTVGGGGKKLVFQEKYKDKIKSFDWQEIFEKVKVLSINQQIKEDLLIAFDLHGIREKLFLGDLTKPNLSCYRIDNFEKSISLISGGLFS